MTESITNSNKNSIIRRPLPQLSYCLDHIPDELILNILQIFKKNNNRSSFLKLRFVNKHIKNITTGCFFKGIVFKQQKLETVKQLNTGLTTWLKKFGLKKLDFSDARKISVLGIGPTLIRINNIDNTKLKNLIQDLESLEELNLGGCSKITDEVLDSLPLSIKVLSLYGCHGISGKKLESLQKLKSLVELDLADCCHQIADEQLKNLPTSIRVLTLDLFNLSEYRQELPNGWEHLQKLKSLEELSLMNWNCHHTAAKRLLCIPSSVKVLSLLRSTTTDEDLQSLQKLTSLVKLNLEDWLFRKQITAKGLQRLPSSIKVLNLNSCRISDEDLEPLQKLPSLEKLNLKNCQRIMGKGLQYLPSSLQELNLNGCNISDENLKPLQKLPSLKKLHLKNCKQITIEKLQTLLPSVKIFK